MGKSSRSTGKGVLIILFIFAILLGAGLGYFLVHIFSPSSSTITSGVILKTKEVTTSTYDTIYDSDLTPQKIEKMNIPMETRGNSYLSIRYFGPCFVSLYSGFNGRAYFNLAIELDGEEKRSTTVFRYSDGPIATTLDISDQIYLEYITPSLSSSNYSIRILWYSTYDNPAGTAQCYVSTAGVIANRTLIVQEIIA